MGLGKRNIGLPGVYTGQKRHNWFMMGHVAGYKGQEPRLPASLSKACRKAYEAGYAKGQADRGSNDVKEI